MTTYAHCSSIGWHQEARVQPAARKGAARSGRWWAELPGGWRSSQGLESHDGWAVLVMCSLFFPGIFHWMVIWARPVLSRWTGYRHLNMSSPRRTLRGLGLLIWEWPDWPHSNVRSHSRRPHWNASLLILFFLAKGARIYEDKPPDS